jgi:hypothetical protein
MAGSATARLGHEPIQPGSGRKRRGIGGIFAALASAAAKAKSLVILLPKLKLLTSFGGLESWRRFRARNAPEGRAYHAIPGRTRALVTATYRGLAGLLGVGVTETFFGRGL